MARFQVTGFGHFPGDMLRKDRCWFASAEDAEKAGGHGRRTIELETDERRITNGRWNSFGWKIEGVADCPWMEGVDHIHVDDLAAFAELAVSA